MHTDLSTHLHTDKCNELIRLLRQCRVDHPAGKFLGVCDHEYIEMTKCLKQERINRRTKNIEMSKERKAKINAILKERNKSSQ